MQNKPLQLTPSTINASSRSSSRITWLRSSRRKILRLKPSLNFNSISMSRWDPIVTCTPRTCLRPIHKSLSSRPISKGWRDISVNSRKKRLSRTTRSNRRTLSVPCTLRRTQNLISPSNKSVPRSLHPKRWSRHRRTISRAWSMSFPRLRPKKPNKKKTTRWSWTRETSFQHSWLSVMKSCIYSMRRLRFKNQRWKRARSTTSKRWRTSGTSRTRSRSARGSWLMHRRRPSASQIWNERFTCLSKSCLNRSRRLSSFQMSLRSHWMCIGGGSSNRLTSKLTN